MIPGVVAAGVGQVSDTGGGDPHWRHVVFLAPFSTDILDYSPRQVPISIRDGWQSQRGEIDVNESTPTGLGCLVLPSYSFAESHADIRVGGKDFTIELFVNSGDSNPEFAGLFSVEGSPGGDYELFTATYTGANHPGLGSIWVSTTGANWSPISGANANFTPLNDGQWHHVALARCGGYLRTFLDGVVKHEINIGGISIPQRGPLMTLGGKGGASAWNTVRINQVRVTLGVARYTENFVPPAEPFPNFGPPDPSAAYAAPNPANTGS